MQHNTMDDSWDRLESTLLRALKAMDSLVDNFQTHFQIHDTEWAKARMDLQREISKYDSALSNQNSSAAFVTTEMSTFTPPPKSDFAPVIETLILPPLLLAPTSKASMISSIDETQPTVAVQLHQPLTQDTMCKRLPSVDEVGDTPTSIEYLYSKVDDSSPTTGVLLLKSIEHQSDDFKSNEGLIHDVPDHITARIHFTENKVLVPSLPSFLYSTTDFVDVGLPLVGSCWLGINIFQEFFLPHMWVQVQECYAWPH